MDRIINCKGIITSEGYTERGYIWIKNGFIKKIGSEIPSLDFPVEEYSECIVAPGYIDTHIHGYKGNEIKDANFESLNNISLNLLECGVTSFLPTISTSSEEEIKKVLNLIAQQGDLVEGARILGVFLEGPFLATKYKGAQKEKFMQSPSIEKIKDFQEIARGKIVKVAIAPELDNSIPFIDYCHKQGIVVALAHSDATYEQAKSAIKHGASVVVHLFNAMRMLHHREPGLVGAALTSPGVFTEIINDGLHIHPEIIRMILKIKGTRQTVLITDSNLTTGLPDGVYQRDNKNLLLRSGGVRLEDGTLAGSALQMSRAVQNCINWEIAEPVESIRMATESAARSIGMEESIGEVAEGRRADLVVLDKKFEVAATYVAGMLKYKCMHSGSL